MRTYNITTQSIALNANSNSQFFALKNIVLYSIAFNITGTPNGSVKLQASNDPETNDTQPTSLTPIHWADIANSTFAVTTSGETMWNVQDVGYNYVRVVYTDSSGGTSTAVATITFNGKGF